MSSRSTCITISRNETSVNDVFIRFSSIKVDDGDRLICMEDVDRMCMSVLRPSVWVEDEIEEKK